MTRVVRQTGERVSVPGRDWAARRRLEELVLLGPVALDRGDVVVRPVVVMVVVVVVAVVGHRAPWVAWRRTSWHVVHRVACGYPPATERSQSGRMRRS